MKILIVCALVAASSAGVLLAATTVKASETRTVDWFVAHPGAMNQVLAACQNDPGTARLSVPACENALAASNHLAFARITAAMDDPAEDARIAARKQAICADPAMQNLLYCSLRGHTGKGR